MSVPFWRSCAEMAHDLSHKSKESYLGYCQGSSSVREMLHRFEENDPMDDTSHSHICRSTCELLLESGVSAHDMVNAARETAETISLSAVDFDKRRLFLRYCQNFNEEQFIKFLEWDPLLPNCRLSADMGIRSDGQTPLHAAASYGNIQALELCLKFGRKVSLFVRDMQGRTPLHIAAMAGQEQTCRFLLFSMEKERRTLPVGIYAPVDLMGDTPLGLAKQREKTRPRNPQLIATLFKIGDASVLPFIPPQQRGGRSTTQGIVFATSSAPGWTPMMEDRTVIHAPLLLCTGSFHDGLQGVNNKNSKMVANPFAWLTNTHHSHQPHFEVGNHHVQSSSASPHCPWTVMAVFDGHGGQFSSQFLSQQLAGALIEQARARHLLTSHTHKIDPVSLRSLIVDSCHLLDELLREDPAMRVKVDSCSNRLSVYDGSGSAAALSVLTEDYIVLANVGDCRAVLAQTNLYSETNLCQGGLNPEEQIRDELLSFFLASTELSDGRDDEDRYPAVITHQIIHGRSTPNPPLINSGNEAYAWQIHSTTTDHKAAIPTERARVLRAGGHVQLVKGVEGSSEALHEVYVDGFGGRLRMTRSFGDFFLKSNRSLPSDQQVVIATPDVIIIPRNSITDRLVLVACDGLFDVFAELDAVLFLQRCVGRRLFQQPEIVLQEALALACDDLIMEAMVRGSVDNISVAVMLLLPTVAPAANTAEEIANKKVQQQTQQAASTAMDECKEALEQQPVSSNSANSNSTGSSSNAIVSATRKALRKRPFADTLPAMITK